MILASRTPGPGSFSIAGCFFVQTQVSSILVVVPDVVAQQPFKMLLVEHDDMIE
jgi:hypothetical protein